MNIFKRIRGWFKKKPKTTPTKQTKPKTVIKKTPTFKKPVKNKQRNITNTKTDSYKEVYTKSPHQSGRIKPKFIIIHDSYGSFSSSYWWILDKKSKVSYHYLINSDGSRTQFVYDTKKAWHAGVSSWKGKKGMNSVSIGVAFWGNTYKRKLSPVEIDSCAWKCVYLMKKFNIPIENILTHKMISPNRKNDTSEKSHQQVIDRITEIL